MAHSDTFRQSIPRRWVIIAVGAALLGFSALTSGIPSVEILGLFVGAATVGNVVAWLVSRADTDHRSLIGLALFLDLAVAAPPLWVFGSGGLLVGLVPVVLPYTSESRPVVSTIQIAGAAGTYVVAVALHGVYLDQPPRAFTDLPVQVLAEVGLFVVVAVVARRTARRTIDRLRAIADRITGTPGDESSISGPGDGVAELEANLTNLRQRIEATASELSRETTSITESSTVVASSAQQANAATGTLVSSSSAIAEGFEFQRLGVEAGERRSATAIEYAREIGEKAEKIGAELDGLLQLAETARKQIHRSREALTSMEHEAASGLSSVRTLQGLGTSMSELLQRVSGVARQVHVLALNTAIKAANNELSRQTSADIAGQFRELASDTSGSAREAAQLVHEMQGQIAKADRTMHATRVEAQDAGILLETSNRILDELHLNALKSHEFIGAVLDVSRIQSENLEDLSHQLARIAEHRPDPSTQIENASDAASRHKAMMEDLQAASSRLATTAKRLREQLAILCGTGEGSDPHHRNGDHLT